MISTLIFVTMLLCFVAIVSVEAENNIAKHAILVFLLITLIAPAVFLTYCVALRLLGH